MSHLLPPPLRPPSPTSLIHKASFSLLFNLSILFISLLQILLTPLLISSITRPWFNRAVNWTKGNFGLTCVGINQIWAPSQFRITVGTGAGDKRDWITFHKKEGRIIGLSLPERAVWISNHQLLADWLYIWSFSYFANLHSSIIITLKSELRWIPFIGWACQFFQFIFLSRSWIKDKKPFLQQLDRLGNDLKRNDEKDGKLALLVFPEGTLVTGNTRPISAKFAEKIGVKDLKHCLLPRSTGLFFSLQTLAKTLPDLELLDLTIAYPLPPSTPPHKYWPEDYYTLLSIYFDSLSPPIIDIYLRSYALHEIPGLEIGDLEGEIKFGNWLRGIWKEKDDLLASYVKNGSFSTGQETVALMPIELRNRPLEYFSALCFGLPVVIIWFLFARVYPL